MPEYCDSDDMQSRLSAVGLTWVADRDASGTGITSDEEAAYVTPAIEYAGNLIDQYISSRTEPTTARASGNTWLRDRCVDIAVYIALTIGGTTPPETAKEQYEFSLGLLRQHHEGHLDIPNYVYAYPARGPGHSTRGPRVWNPR